MNVLSRWRAALCVCGLLAAAICFSWGSPVSVVSSIGSGQHSRRLVAITIGEQASEAASRGENEEGAQDQGEALLTLSSQCPPLKLKPQATTVRNIRPVDVKVVAAIGDSITAAFAARGWLPLEFRGLSFPIGGDKGRVTLPNILSLYSETGHPPVGAASGWTDPLVDASHILKPQPMKPIDPKNAHLDAAISNGVASGGPNQTLWLEKVMAQYEQEGKLSMKDDWKLLVLTLGANDLRAVCRGHTPPAEVASKFKAQINETLALVKQKFPRTFVALNAVPNVGDMGKWGHSSWMCSEVQDHLEGGHCPQGGESTSVQVAMNEALAELQAYWSDTVRADDFAVVYQPFTGNMTVPDVKYLSALDCFHPGERGHAEAAVALWNSLITPRHSKKTSFHVGGVPICADENTTLHVD